MIFVTLVFLDTPSPQMLMDDNEPIMPSAIRQRRLPLIGTLPPSVSLRSPDHYASPYHTPRSDRFISRDVVYYTPTDSIPSPSPNSVHNFPIYGRGIFFIFCSHNKLIRINKFME